MLYVKYISKKTTSVGKAVQKLKLSHTASGHIKWCPCCGKQFGSSPNVKHRVTIRPSNYTPTYIYLKELKTEIQLIQECSNWKKITLIPIAT